MPARPCIACWPSPATRPQVSWPKAWLRSRFLTPALSPSAGQARRRCGIWPLRRQAAPAGAEPPRLSVAFVLGGDLCQQTLAGWPLPPGLDARAAALCCEAGRWSWAWTRTCDLDVSAEAEIVCEGFIETHGVASPSRFAGKRVRVLRSAADAPRVQLTAVTHRANPCLPLEVVGFPHASAARWKGAERLLAAWLQNIVPEAVDLALPACGQGRVAFVALRKAIPQHARQAASAVWGSPPLRHVKLLVLVDAGVNLHAADEVWRQVAAHAIWGETRFSRLARLTPTTMQALQGFGAHLGLDATAKLPGEASQTAWPQAADRGAGKPRPPLARIRAGGELSHRCDKPCSRRTF